MVLAVLALLLGFLAGQALTLALPASFATYLSVAILATLDSTLGGIKGVMLEKYDGAILMSGFFINGSISAFMVLMGDWIGVDLYYVAIFVFGIRIFQNLAIIRRELIDKLLPPVAKRKSTVREVS
ncbi:small basic family protein [Phosphitispora fastidiosa]|uniref:small basic family protein n=1 Tax=Phosphitispora fastidiosa TaxID=2837202 RepID=UPI001E3AB126|nr:small basic family protein [Phosphitispora fastidiosa]MBU7006880.1 small basic protein [Phosphitispora fastidiosa]